MTGTTGSTGAPGAASGTASGASGGSSGGASTTVAGGSSGGSGGLVSDGGTLAASHPCDKGIGNDPAVVWSENFGEGSLAAFQARYDQVDDTAGQTLVADVPTGSCSTNSIQLVSSGDAGANATDFYKNLALPDGGGYDDWYIRWYAKYQGSVQWHHAGVWFGGYDPPLAYPYPHAGELPVGNDRFSVAIEPIWGIGGPNAQFDTYNYWMEMHSYEADPMGTGAYYGNSVVQQTGFIATDSTWVCLEIHVLLNSDPSSATGAAMDVWRNDVLLQHYDEQGPLGFWTADKFCPSGANESYCLEYPAPANTVLDLQWRSTPALQLNYFWPQNYITDPGAGTLQFADMVVATTRVGCIQ
jgi:hypothetical protein